MPPNLLIVLTDDQRADLLSPGLSQLAGAGFHFVNAFATTPVCGPSRASLLTGQLARTHGCTSNAGTAVTFSNRPALGQALQAAGYTTAWAGKWLNGYDLVAPTVPPGWHHWIGYVAPQVGEHFNYTLCHNGQIVPHTNAYLTDLLATECLAWIATLPEPWCIVYAPGAPHSPYTPHPGYAGDYLDDPWTPPPGAFESDMTDKPQWLRDFQAAHAGNQAQLTEEIRNRRNAQREMLISVDDALESFLTALTTRGVLAQTAIVYLSDNGIQEHEHWWHQKMTPYEPALRVPLVIRYAGWGGAPVGVQKLVTVMDVGVTLAALAGTTLPNADGHDLRTIFVNPPAWRTHFPIEYWPHFTYPWFNVPGFTGAREKDLVYWQLQDAVAFEELYDLKKDPGQLVNRVNDPLYAQDKARLRQEAGL